MTNGEWRMRQEIKKKNRYYAKYSKFIDIKFETFFCSIKLW